MNHINVSPARMRPTMSRLSTGLAIGLGDNLVTDVVVLAVLIVAAWYLFTSLLRGVDGGGTIVDVNTPAGSDSQYQPESACSAGRHSSSGQR